ncbi:MAG: alanine racemase [Pseudomonadota bacterium]
MAASNCLTISLAALTANYRQLQAAAQGEVAAVVKADGYGLGAPAVAGHLASIGCREFFVATAAEGQRLRRQLQDAVIYVLEGVLPESLPLLVQARLIPILNSSDQAELWGDQTLPAGLHLDTGMQRLGMDAVQALTVLAKCNVTLLMTHLSRADEPANAFNALQVERFQAQATQLLNAAAEPRKIRLSVCNSAGMLQGFGPEHVGRAGIALYGGNPFSELANPMHPVVSLTAQILQTRHVEEATPVGYGGTYVTSQPRRLATLAAGYADGVPRLLSNLGRVWAQQRYFPVVGRVSMDMLHIDVTDAPELQPGDWMEVMGPHVSIDEVAGHAQTISYEVLTGLRPRGDCLWVERLL